jgi:hypothetical protein
MSWPAAQVIMSAPAQFKPGIDTIRICLKRNDKNAGKTVAYSLDLSNQ